MLHLSSLIPEPPIFLDSPHQRTEEAKRYERFYSRERSSRMGQITALDRGVGAVVRYLCACRLTFEQLTDKIVP